VSTTTVADDDLSALFGAADEASGRGQASYLRWTKVRLCAVVAVAGAALAPRPTDSGALDWAALTGVLLFLAAASVEIFLLRSRPDRDWYDCRALAESVKTMSWKFMVCGNPFPDSMSDKDASAAFASEVGLLLESPPQARIGPVAGPAITSTMRGVRRLSLPERRRIYIRDRVQNQQHWYSSKAKSKGKAARYWRGAVLALELTGAVLLLLRGVGLLPISLGAVFAAAAAAAAAILEARRDEQTARAYVRATADLAAVRSELDLVDDEGEWARVVDDAEEAISREHVVWLASRSTLVA